MTTVSTILKYDLSGSSGVVGESPYQAKAKLDELHTWQLTDKLNKLTMYQFTVPNTEFYRANAIIERSVFVPFLKPFRGIVCAKEQNESTITLTACELAFHLTRRIFRLNSKPRIVYGAPITNIQFEENVLDKGVQSNDGTWTGTESYSRGSIGEAGVFTGSQRVTLTGTSGISFENTDPFTVSLRVITSASAQDSLVSQAETSGNFRGWEVTFLSGGVIRFIRRSTNTNEAIIDTTSGGFNDGDYHHIVCKTTGGIAASTMSITVDNVIQAVTIADDDLTTTMVNSEDVVIGARGDGTFPITGNIDDVNIWGRALSVSNIDSEFRRRSNRPEDRELKITTAANVLALDIITAANLDMPSDITWKLAPNFPTGDTILEFHYQNHYQALNLIAEALGKDLFFDNKARLVFIETKGKTLGKKEELDIIITSKPEVSTEDFANDINLLGKRTGGGEQLEHRVQTNTVLRFNYEKVVADSNLNTQDQLSDIGDALLTEFQKLTPQTKGEIPVTQFHRLALSSGDIVKISQPDKQLSGDFRVMDIIIQPNKVKVSLEKTDTAIVRVRSSSLVDVIDGILKRLQEQSIET